jgi:hypothetical protein
MASGAMRHRRNENPKRLNQPNGVAKENGKGLARVWPQSLALLPVIP